MPAVSQGLLEFANHFRQPPSPGIEILVTPRYQIAVQPDLPIPGPNSVTWIRCRREDADVVVVVHRRGMIRRARVVKRKGPRRRTLRQYRDPES